MKGHQVPKNQLAGLRFGRLTVGEWVRPEGSPSGKWECVCDCGRTTLAATKHLKNGDVKSCGCLVHQPPKSKTHGMSKTAIYRVWRAMRRRCQNERDKSYANYGGRGISVCERWEKFENFVTDMGPRPPLGTIERIDNNGNYEPSNCCWATRAEQNRNTRVNRLIEHAGEVLCLAAWSERLGIGTTVIARRMDVQGMTFAQAITTPSRYSVWRRSKVEPMREAA